MKELENKFVFVFERKKGQPITKKLTTQDKSHLRIIAICQMLAEKNQKAIALIMKSAIRENFVIDESGQEVRYEIILCKQKKQKIIN